MPRILPVATETADAETKDLLAAVKKKMGMVPNIISTMAQSPAVANAYLGFSQSLGGGKLPVKLREQISLVVGEANSCGYCVAAHTVLGKGAGLEDEAIVAARRGTSWQSSEQAALEFAQKVVRERGNVTDTDISQVRDAGFSDGEICEIIASVALNVFTNYFNHVAGTEIDFPPAPELAST